MCDEYDDERMRAFWRQLALHADDASLDHESEPAGEPLAPPVGKGPEPQPSKPRALVH